MIYRQSDHLGSSVLVTRSDGAVIERALYRPFGEIVPATAGATEIAPSFGFTGQRFAAPVGIGPIRAVTDQAFSGGPQPDRWMPGTIANLARWDTVASYQGEMRGLTPEAVGEFDARKITVPTLLVHGDDDRLAPVAISRYLASRIPNSELLEVENGSHMLPVTHAELLADRIAVLAAAP